MLLSMVASFGGAGTAPPTSRRPPQRFRWQGLAFQPSNPAAKRLRSTGDSACPTGDAACPTGDSACPPGDAACPTGDSACPTGDAACPTGDSACPTGDSV